MKWSNSLVHEGTMAYEGTMVHKRTMTCGEVVV